MRGVEEPDGAAAIAELPYVDGQALARGHVLVTRRIFAAVKRRAERVGYRA